MKYYLRVFITVSWIFYGVMGYNGILNCKNTTSQISGLPQHLDPTTDGVGARLCSTNSFYTSEDKYLTLTCEKTFVKKPVNTYLVFYHNGKELTETRKFYNGNYYAKTEHTFNLNENKNEIKCIAYMPKEHDPVSGEEKFTIKINVIYTPIPTTSTISTTTTTTTTTAAPVTALQNSTPESTARTSTDSDGGTKEGTETNEGSFTTPKALEGRPTTGSAITTTTQKADVHESSWILYAGIGAGVLVLLLLVITVLYCWCRKRSKEEERRPISNNFYGHTTDSRRESPGVNNIYQVPHDTLSNNRARPEPEICPYAVANYSLDNATYSEPYVEKDLNKLYSKPIPKTRRKELMYTQVLPKNQRPKPSQRQENPYAEIESKTVTYAQVETTAKTGLRNVVKTEDPTYSEVVPNGYVNVRNSPNYKNVIPDRSLYANTNECDYAEPYSTVKN